jgi:N-acetyltransferase 10
MGVQKCILLAIGLQRKDLEAVTVDLPSLTTAQVLPQFNRMMRSFAAHFSAVISSAVEAELSRSSTARASREKSGNLRDDATVDERFQALSTKQDEQDDEEGSAADETELLKKKRELIDSLPLDQ